VAFSYGDPSPADQYVRVLLHAGSTSKYAGKRKTARPSIKAESELEKLAQK
jgi:hypothetical protein